MSNNKVAPRKRRSTTKEAEVTEVVSQDEVDALLTDEPKEETEDEGIQLTEGEVSPFDLAEPEPVKTVENPMSGLNTLDMIAKVVIDTNHVYDPVDTFNWEESSEELRDSIRIGIAAVVANPYQTPEQSHISWLKTKTANGWVYGETKNFEAKTHPCMVHYDHLQEIHRKKNEMFVVMVSNMLAILGEPEDLPTIAEPEFIPLQMSDRTS